MAQAQDLIHERPIIQALVVHTLVGGSGHPGPIEVLAQAPVVRVGHDVHVGGWIQAEQPTGQAISLSFRCRSVQNDLGNPADPLAVCLVVDKRIRGVHQVLLESGLQARQLLHNLLERVFGGPA